MAGGLVLGPVLFHGFEIPERISFGGQQRLAVHTMPGGGRVVDAMGPEERPVGWSGVFSGPGAAARVRLLERLRREGGVLPLAWEGWRFTVVIETFTAETVNPAWIPYRLRVVIVAVGDEAPPEDAIAPFSLAEAAALGSGATVEAEIAAADAMLASDDVGVAIGGAGLAARLVAGRAIAGAANKS